MMHNNQEQLQVNGEPEISVSILQQHSYYNFYRFEIAKQVYVAKVFPSDKEANYQQEISTLQQLTHPNIVKPLSPSSSLSTRLAAIFNAPIIVFPEATHKSLLHFIEANNYVSERVCKFFLNQVVSALSYAETKAITHTNLSVDNILMEHNYNLLLCGWSKTIQLKKDLCFSLATLAINLVIGRTPFVCRDLKVDPYGKFLTDKLIHKFWEQSEKFTRRINTKFIYSEEFKTIFGAMLLGKINSLPTFADTYLKEGVMAQADACKELEDYQNMGRQRKADKRLVEKRQQLQEQALTVEGEGLALNRQFSRCHEAFLQQYNTLKDEALTKLPQKSNSDKRSYFELFNNDVRIVLAHLRAKLNEVCLKQKEEWFVDPLLVLRAQSTAELEGSEIKVFLPFGWNLSEIESHQGISAVSMQVSICLGTEKGTLWGTFGQIDCPDLQTSCVKWVVRWLREVLQLYA